MSDVERFTITEVLRPGLTHRAIDSTGNPVILKRLDPACLQHGRLHPNVKERLARIRELPLRDLAVLHSVELVDDQPTLVWDDLDGETLEQFARRGSTPTLARDITLLIQALHGHGIVHGAIHAKNIIVDPTGRPRLTHLSPLLHHDPAFDLDDLAKMLRELNLIEPPALNSTLAAEQPIWRILLGSAAFWLAIALAAAAIAGGVWVYRVEQRGLTPTPNATN